MTDPSAIPPVPGESPTNDRPLPAKPASVSGRRLGRALLVLVLLAGGGYLGWTRFDRGTADRLNGAREELGGLAATLTTTSPDEAALRTMHARLTELAGHGGLRGPTALHDLVDPARAEFARQTAERAAALLPVVALAAGDLALATADLERAPANGGPLLAQARRFVEGMAAASPEERELLRQAFLAGLRAGAGGAAPSTGPVTVESARGDQVQALYRTAVVWNGPLDERLAALEQLTKVEGADAELTKALVKLCRVDEQRVADASLAALKRLDPKRLAAVLEREREKADPEAREGALLALGEAGLDPEQLGALAEPIGAAARKPTVREALALLERAGSRAARGFVLAAKAPEGEPTQVVRAISELPEAEQRALVPAVLEILGSLTDERHAYAFELGAQVVALEPSPSVAALAALLDPARHPECRAHVAKLLEQLGPRGRDAAPALVKCLGGKSELGWRAADALIAVGVAPGLAAAIDSGSTSGRRDAVRVARGLPSVAREVVPELLRATTEEDDELSVPAAVALENLDAADLAPHLSRIGELLALPGAPAIHMLDLVAKLGPAARPLLPQVQGWFAAADPNPFAFEAALAMLEALKLTPTESVTTLAGVLDTRRDEVAQAAAAAIGGAAKSGQVGAEAVALALPGLIAGLGRESVGARQNCAWALNQVPLAEHPAAVKEAVPALVRLLQDPEAAVRINALCVLWSLGGAAAPAVERLAATVADPDERVARLAIQTLARLGPAATEALPALEKVAAAGGPLAPDARAAIEALKGTGG